MRIHFLEHDPLDLTHTNFTRWARRKGYATAHTFLCNDQKLPSIDDVDWLMVMGGSPHAWEEDVHPWLAAEKKFIARALDQDKIVMGVCFGAQLLAEVLGGAVSANRHKEIGWYEVTLTQAGCQSFLFRNLPQRFVTFHWHSDHFSLPPGCTRLAYSEPTAQQAFVLEGKPVVGLQFHPEYTREMVSRFARECGDEWKRGPFVAGCEAVLAQTEKLTDTDWLADRLLDNMEREFTGVGKLPG